MELLLRYAVMVFAVGYLIWTVWRYVTMKKAAQFVDNATFASHLRTGQLLDLRDAASFQRQHILGARHFPLASLKDSLSALRKDKPVLLYDDRRGVGTVRALSILKKAGFTDIYVLKDGFEHWNGKVKKS